MRSSGWRTAASISCRALTSAASPAGHGRIRRRGQAAGLRLHVLATTTGAYLPYGIIVMLNTSRRCSGRTSRDPSGWTRTRCTQHRAGDALRGAGRPQAVFAMERSMDAIGPSTSARTPRGREANLIRRRRCRTTSV
ncbi:molybdopterin-dependent oxidoreductase [Rhodococcus hoagii]|nr:molybdopterin-dependent oxidoreductase [Prescottella equi]